MEIDHFRTGLSVCAFIVAASTGHAVAQTPSHDAPRLLERPDDPYLPGPDGGGIAGVSGTTVFGGFTSIQVNVDELGSNFFGDAANEPSIAVDPTAPNRMAIG